MYTQLFLLFFASAVVVSGEVVKKKDVTFYLNQESQWSKIQLKSQNENVLSKIPKNSKVVLVMHGWTQNRTAYFVKLVSEAYLSRDFTVIAVDYSKTSKKIYKTAVEEIPQVGELSVTLIRLVSPLYIFRYR